MSRKTKSKADSRGYVRCGHRWCRDCRTKRGRNRGVRRVRRLGKALIRKFEKEQA